MQGHIRKTEAGVLKTYTTVNPSALPIEKNKKEYARKRILVKRLFLHRLQFPPKMFQGAEVLEFGAGTGEHSLSYLEWGARCTFIDMNPRACERMKIVLSLFAPPHAVYKIENRSLFEFKTNKRFDITISKGVLHHTADAEKAFALQVKYLRKGGFTVLGIGNSAGYLQRNLSRLILYTFADAEKDIAALADELFREHISRAEKFGGRTKMQIIYDAYVNPKFHTVSVSDVFRWFDKHKLVLYSSWPPLIPALLGDASGREPLAYTNAEWSALLALPELVWCAHEKDDSEALKMAARQSRRAVDALSRLTSAISDIELGKPIPLAALQKCITPLKKVSAGINPYAPHIDDMHALVDEVAGLLPHLMTKDLSAVRRHIKKAKRLFRGTAGLGMNYFVGYKTPW